MKPHRIGESPRQFRSWLIALGLALAALLLFMELAEDIWLNDAFVWDTSFMRWLHGLGRPWLDVALRAVTESAGGLILLPLAASATWFWRHRERFAAVLLLTSFGGNLLLNNLLKLLFARPRPALFPPLVVETGYSFPSGHTMSAIAFYGLLALLLWQRGRHGWAILPGVWAPLVGLSRIYLGTHYPSDVLASLAVGTIWLVFVWIAFAGQHTRRGLARRPAQTPY